MTNRCTKIANVAPWNLAKKGAMYINDIIIIFIITIVIKIHLSDVDVLYLSYPQTFITMLTKKNHVCMKKTVISIRTNYNIEYYTVVWCTVEHKMNKSVIQTEVVEIYVDFT